MVLVMYFLNVWSATQLATVCSGSDLSGFDVSMPASVATLSSSASVRPLVPSSGCCANIASTSASVFSGWESTTQETRLADRVEYSLPLENRSRIAIGLYSMTIVPSSTSLSSVVLFVSSKPCRPGTGSRGRR